MHRPIHKIKFLSGLVIGFILIFDLHLCFSQRITYQLEIDEQNWNAFHVRIFVENVNEKQIVFVMPSWRPGAYVRSEFGQYVRNFQAFGSSTQPLQVVRLNDGMWSINLENSSLARVEYDVDHARRRMMGKYMDISFALVDGAMNFMYIKDKEHLPLHVEFRVPHGWKLATALPGEQTAFEFDVADYHQLIDCPVLMSRFSDYYFTINNRQFYVIISGRRNFDINEFLVMIKRIVSYQTKLFAEVPFDKYFFLFQIFSQGDSGGGLEHSNSTYISLSKNLVSKDLKAAAEIVAHEFFHAWNVKRIQPRVLQEASYTREARTKNLWFCEGVTSYYADLTMIRSNIWSEQEFLQRITQLIDEVQSNNDRLKTSMERASLETWERSFHSEGISYYTKGELIGLLLDLTIRELTNNRQSLDDLMRFMNWWFARSNVGYEEDDILRALSAMTYRDFSGFFNQYISGTVELPYQETLQHAGIMVETFKDTVSDLGIMKIMGDKNKIVVLEDMSPLSDAGLKKGDYLISIDGKTVGGYIEMTQTIQSLTPGTEIIIIVEREGIRLNLNAKVNKKELLKSRLQFVAEPTERQLRIRKGWLEGAHSCFDVSKP